MTAATRRRKSVPSPWMGEGESSGMYAIANPPQPPFCKGGSYCVRWDYACAPFCRGGSHGVRCGDAYLPFCEGGSHWVRCEDAFPPFFEGGSHRVRCDDAFPPFGKGGQGGFALRQAQLCHH